MCLVVLDFRFNFIGNEGVWFLVVFLVKNFYIWWLNIFLIGIDYEGCKNLLDVFKLNNIIIEIDMSFFEIGDSGCICFGNMLK